MNHVAFDVAPDKIDEYRKRLLAMGVECTEVVNHDDSEGGVSEEISPSTFVRSIYFKDPGRHAVGVCLLGASING